MTLVIVLLAIPIVFMFALIGFIAWAEFCEWLADVEKEQ